MAEKIRVWDIPIRLFHWTFAGLFIFLILSGKYLDNMMQWHMRAGYGIIALAIFRILWGCFGTYYARFAQFIRSPFQAISYLKDTLTGKAEHYLGHNPAGAWMVVALILGLSLQATTGLFISDEILWDGPFYGVLSDDLTSLAGTIHINAEWYLIALVAIHIAAVLFHLFRYKEPLISAMIHGKKPNPTAAPVKENTKPSLIALSISLVISGSILVWLWNQPI
jgi:cytochrome b